jgi:hypothetical protein
MIDLSLMGILLLALPILALGLGLIAHAIYLLFTERT